MSTPVEVRTERLVLRRWRSTDREPFAAMNADPTVMRHFPAPLDRAASDALVDRIEAGFERHGFGLWAVEVVGGPAFAGFVGLSVVEFDAPVRGRTEIGWRLVPEVWGRGYATEAATEVLQVAFERLGLGEVVSFTVPANAASRAVMDRVGLQRRPDLDFEHPRLPVDSPLRAHVVYAVGAEGWRRGLRSGAGRRRGSG